MDVFKPSNLRQGFSPPRQAAVRSRRNYEMVLFLAALGVAGIFIHWIASKPSQEWPSSSPSDQNAVNFAAESKRNRKSLSSVVTQPWVRFPTARNETRELLDQWRHHEVSKCNTVQTSKIRIDGLPNATPGLPVRLQSGVIHKIFIVSLDGQDEQLCEGGDYFETDLSGERWKARPPVTDLQNGTYEVLLQVDERFTGLYEFKVILLYSRFNGLKLLSWPSFLVRGEEMAALQILFEEPHHGRLPKEPSLCGDGDYMLARWSGRWTRSQKNESCVMSSGGRYLCLPPNTPCELPWCEGPLDKVDSNGWVYSAHCRFKLFTPDEAWNCLDKKWLFSWGDSTSQHTWQNLLAFIMDYADISSTDVPRRMDREWVRPKRASSDNKSDQAESQSFRLTMIYNGHAEEEGEFQGLESLNVPLFRDYLRAFFVNSSDPTHTPPDILVMNSGLHDAFFYKNPDEYVQKGVLAAVQFWKEILETIKPHSPQIIYRTSVATAGTARSKQYNPQKVEHYNRLFVDSLQSFLSPPAFRIVDGFDLTFPWHYTNAYSDGTHYGLKPGLGVPGHQYFVDHMFAHMLLNSICLR